jgi:hypothetical protein
MFSRRDWRDELQDDVLHHLSGLRREVMALSGDTRNSLQHGAQEIGDVLMDQGAVLARRFGKQAMRTAKAVRHDPVPAVVGAIGLACLASLVMSRKQ